MAPPLIRVPQFEKIPGLVHAFTTRIGGVSASPYDSLNLGTNTQDDHDCVARNHDLLAAALEVPKGHFFGVQQVHGTRVLCVGPRDKPQMFHARRADVLLSKEKGVFLMIRVADCLPILWVDPISCAVGVAHVGWRGLLAGAVTKTVAEIKRIFSSRTENLFAAIGPAIGFEKFEVSFDVAELFFKKHALLPDEYAEAGKSVRLNLSAIARRLAVESGVIPGQIWVCPECTFLNADRFFSYRRDGEQTGRIAGVIGWTA